MNLLLSMSLAGSIVFLAYLVLRPLTVRYFSSAWRSRLLKTVLLFYLLPYQYFKYLYYDLFNGIFFHRQYRSTEFENGQGFYDLNRVLLIDSEGNYLLKNGKRIFAILAVWFVLVLLFVICQVIEYFLCKKKLRQISAAPDSGYQSILDQCRKRLCVKKEADLFCCSYINTPFTIGVLSPRITMPEMLREKKAFQMVVSHELTHVKNHDILVKLLALLVVVLHWFNPLTYCLYREICKVLEGVCDETVTKDMPPEEKEKYKLLIIEMARKPSHLNKFFTNALSADYKMIKERIKLMDRSIVSSKIMRAAAFALAVLLIVMSPLPVMAYSPLMTYKSDHMENKLGFQGSLRFNFNPDEGDTYGINDPFLELGTDCQIFIGDDGVPIQLSEPESEPERSICFHSWESGLVENHIPDNEGGCTVYIYNAQACYKCSSIKDARLISTTKYEVCPH